MYRRRAVILFLLRLNVSKVLHATLDVRKKKTELGEQDEDATPDLAILAAKLDLSLTLHRRGSNLQEAEELQRAVVAGYEAAFGQAHELTFLAKTSLAYTLYDKDAGSEEALGLLRAAWQRG